MPRAKKSDLLALVEMKGPRHLRRGRPSQIGELVRLGLVAFLLTFTCSAAYLLRVSHIEKCETHETQNETQTRAVFHGTAPVGEWNPNDRTLIMCLPGSKGEAEIWDKVKTFAQAEKIRNKFWRIEK